MTTVRIDRSQIHTTQNGSLLHIRSTIDDCQRGSAIDFAGDDVDVIVDLDNATFNTNELNVTKLGELIDSVRLFGSTGYHDKTGEKQLYVLNRDFLGYKKGKLFFSRGEMAFPEGVSQDCAGFNLKLAIEMNLFSNNTLDFKTQFFDNKKAVIYDPDDLCKIGSYISINGIGMFKVDFKQYAEYLQKGYCMVNLS